MPPRTPKPRPRPREITITVKVRSIIDGVLQEHVLRALAEELVKRIGTEAKPSCVAVEMAAIARLEHDQPGVQ